MSFFIRSSIVSRLRRRRRFSRSQAWTVGSESDWQGVDAGLACFASAGCINFLVNRLRRESESDDAGFRVIVLRSHLQCVLSVESVELSSRFIHRSWREKASVRWRKSYDNKTSHCRSGKTQKSHNVHY